MELQIRRINDKAVMPTYATQGSAGMDLYACIDEPVTLGSLERVLIPTGLQMAVPMGYEAQIRPRSGLSSKHGITLANCVGTIDSDFRGEVCVSLVNISNKPYVINPNERVAQLVVAKCEQANIVPVDVLDETERGIGGFGSSGKF